jgi:hypothetical protein
MMDLLYKLELTTSQAFLLKGVEKSIAIFKKPLFVYLVNG